MEGPVDLRMQPYAPARLFTKEEASALLPRLAEIFRRMDPQLARLREIEDLVEDAEAYWHTTGDGMPAEERTVHDRIVAQAAERQARGVGSGSGEDWGAVDPAEPIAPWRMATWIFRFEDKGERIKR